jgi:hypothetical protein
MYAAKRENKARYVSLIAQRFQEFGEDLFLGSNIPENQSELLEEKRTDF